MEEELRKIFFGHKPLINEKPDGFEIILKHISISELKRVISFSEANEKLFFICPYNENMKLVIFNN